MPSDELPLPEPATDQSAVPLDPPSETSLPHAVPTALPVEEPAPPAPAPDMTDTLAGFVELTKTGRLSPAGETRAAELLRDALLGGRAEIDDALDAILLLPWPISVNALNDAWPTMKPYGRRLFVTGMKAGKFEGDSGRRIRLSLTRGLAKIDDVQAAKWACAIAQEMLGPDDTLAVRDRQAFFNVFIGKGKPWLLRFPITGLKDAEVRPFLTCAVLTVFNGGCPPFTQSSLLLWMIANKKADALDEKSAQTIALSIRRWPGRVLRDYQGKIADLPAAIAEALIPRGGKKTGHEETAAEEPGDYSPAAEAGNGATAEPAGELEKIPTDVVDDSTEPETEPAEGLEEVLVQDHENEEEDENDEDDEDEDEDEEDEDEDDEDEEEAERRGGESRESRDESPRQRRVHPPYISPGQPLRPATAQTAPSAQPARGQGGSNLPASFDPVAALRQLDNFVRQQGQQLQQTRLALRQREEELRRGGGGAGGRRDGRDGRDGRRGSRSRDRNSADSVWPETIPTEDAESLRRIVGQLETTNAELRQRLEDLASDGEQKAQGLTAPDGTPLGEREQLCHFLSLKLGREHADFLRLQREPSDEVFREHYRILLTSVFDILAAEGIVPKAPES